MISFIQHFEADFPWKVSMESRPKNPEFRINPENFHPCLYRYQNLMSWHLIEGWKNNKHQLTGAKVFYWDFFAKIPQCHIAQNEQIIINNFIISLFLSILLCTVYKKGYMAYGS